MAGGFRSLIDLLLGVDAPPPPVIELAVAGPLSGPVFRIDVLDANGDKVGDGPIIGVERVTIRRSLDKIGGAKFPLMAVEPKTIDVGAGRRYRLHHRQYGNLGTFRHAKQSLGAASDAPRLAVDADDQLVELTLKNVYFRRGFNHIPVEDVVFTLAAIAGWDVGEIESGLGNTTVSYEGESVFEALDVLRDRWGVHFRLGGPEELTLDFGSFGEDSGIWLIRPPAVPAEMFENEEVALITNLEISEESQAIINRLIPIGAGAGVTQLTLQHVTEFDPLYPVLAGVNGDGSAFYYIEDGDSITAYGLVERPFERNDIRPLSNATVNLQNAANALYRAALAALLKWKQPRTYYKVGVTKLDPRRLKPGDLARLTYRGIAEVDGVPYKWVDVDELLWVLEIEESYGPDGQQAVSLEVGTSGDRRTSDGDVLARITRDVKVFKTHVQPNLTHSPVKALGRLDLNNPVEFEIRLQDEVLAVNRVLMRFLSRPLRSSVVSVAAAGASVGTSGSGGGSQQTSQAVGSHSHESVRINRELIQTQNNNHKGVFVHQNDGSLHFFSNDGGPSQHVKISSANNAHNHSISIPNHSHSLNVPGHEHAMAYGLFQDTSHPQVISLTINGVDQTATLGGPWAPSNAPVSVELDITQYILRGQVNTLRFSCAAGRGEIDFLADCLLTIQAIVVV